MAVTEAPRLIFSPWPGTRSDLLAASSLTAPPLFPLPHFPPPYPILGGEEASFPPFSTHIIHSPSFLRLAGAQYGGWASAGAGACSLSPFVWNMVGEMETKEKPKPSPDYLMQLMNDKKLMSSLPNFCGIFNHLERLLDEGKTNLKKGKHAPRSPNQQLPRWVYGNDAVFLSSTNLGLYGTWIPFALPVAVPKMGADSFFSPLQWRRLLALPASPINKGEKREVSRQKFWPLGEATKIVSSLCSFLYS